MILSSKNRNTLVLISCTLIFLILQLKEYVKNQTKFYNSVLYEVNFASEVYVTDLKNNHNHATPICQSYTNCAALLNIMHNAKAVIVIDSEQIVQKIKFKLTFVANGISYFVLWDDEKNLITIDKEKWYKINRKDSNLINLLLRG